MIDNILLEFAEKMQALTESSLTQVMNDPMGQKLAKYLHTHRGLPDQVEVKPVPLDYMKTLAWTTGTEYVVFKGKKGWVLREPNSAVPVRITDEDPSQVHKEAGIRKDRVKWEDYIEPVAVYSINKPQISDKVLARPNRQRSPKAPELAVSHRLLTPAIVASVTHGAKVDLKRWNQKRKLPWKPEDLRAWFTWLDALKDALTDGENEVMSDIDWDSETPDDERFAEAEDFWNYLVYSALPLTDEWKAAKKADVAEINAKYPDQAGARARGVNVPRYGSHTTALIKNTVFLQKLKGIIIDNLTDFVSSHDLT
jgi:hypothetical protein